MCLLTFSLVRRGFLRVFNMSAFRFLLILCRGLGHQFGSCVASLVPLWVTLAPFSTSFCLFYGRPGAPRASEKLAFLTWQTLAKHAHACTDRASRPPQTLQKQGRHREVSKKHKNSTKSAPRQRPGTPTRAPGPPKEPRRRPRERKRPPKRNIVAPWRCPSL